MEQIRWHKIGIAAVGLYMLICSLITIAMATSTSNSPMTINLRVGETYILKGSRAVVTKKGVVTTTHDPVQLKDHALNVKSSLQSFSPTEDISIHLTDAEFTFIEAGAWGNDLYRIYNKTTDTYLVNLAANEFFSPDAESNMLVKPVVHPGNGTFFRICREDGKRYINFYYFEMDFNTTTAYDPRWEHGNYDLMLLHKEDEVSATDVLPGYSQATKIISGDKYLIGYQWEGKFILLYPENGTANQTKLTDIQKDTIVLAATAPGETDVFVDGQQYHVKVSSILKAGSDQGPSGTTVGQPFAAGTGGSDRFRIPGLTTLNNGWLLAAADARYTTSGDGGGLDTMVSISQDTGINWKYFCPVFFPDSKGYLGNQATTVIDPLVTQSRYGTIHLLVDACPTGVATMSGYTYHGPGTGYIKVKGKDRLAITGDYNTVNIIPTDTNVLDYSYYVGDFSQEGYAPLLSRFTHQCNGYVVDRCYNLYAIQNGRRTVLTQKQVGSDTDIQQNVFYKDSEFHVYNTGYLWLATSEDNGDSWNHTILNAQVKKPGEITVLVAPGRGTVLPDNFILLPCYNQVYTESIPRRKVETASFIWSNDDGKTWHRSGDVPRTKEITWSSENEIVYLNDTTVRMFFRNGTDTICYADATWDQNKDNFTFSNPVSTGVKCRSRCKPSAIKYSKQIDSKDAILVACPGDPNARAKGRIFIFLMGENDSMNLAYTFHINEGEYAYSCLTELDNGRIGLLWEPKDKDPTALQYSIYDITDIADGCLIDNRRVRNVPLYGILRDTWPWTFIPVPKPSDTIVNMKLETINGTVANVKSDGSDTDKEILLRDALYTFTSKGNGAYTISNETADGKTVYLNIKMGKDTIPNYPFPANIKVTKSNGNAFNLQDQTVGVRGSYLYFYHTKEGSNNLNFGRVSKATSPGTDFLLYRPVKDGESSSNEISGYVQVSTTEISSGSKYLIVAKEGNNYYALYPSDDTNSKYAHVAKVGGIKKNTYITYTGNQEGSVDFKETVSQVNYTIKVKAKNVIEVPLKVKASTSISVNDAKIAKEPDEKIAKAELKLEDKRITVTGAQGRLGTDAKYSGNLVPMSNALYLFTKNSDNTYQISSQFDIGNTIYLNIKGGKDTIPNSSTPTNIKVTKAQNNAFNLEDQAAGGNGGYLYFYRTKKDKNNLNFGRNSVAETPNTEFLLYRPANKEDAPRTEIPGYARVTKMEEIKDGDYYLIVANVNGTYYALYPSNKTDNKYCHVIKANPKSQQVTDMVGTIANELTITGMGHGTTDVAVGGVIYRVSVAGDGLE